LPLTATQILWINLVTASTLGLALAFEPPEPGIMERQPRRRDAPLLSPFLLWRVALVSVLFTGSVLLVFFGSLRLGESVETARTMSVNMLIAAEVFYLFNVRFLHRRSFSWRGALGTPAVLAALAVLIAAQLAFTYLPILNTLLDSRPLSAMQLFMVIGLGALLMIVIEIEKLAMRRLGWFSELSA
jgi:magnesium-transporting ATPase (P-type)